MKNLLYFLTGGIVTYLIVILEEGGYRTLSGLVAIMPVFTLVSYVFIGSSDKGGNIAVSQHSYFVLLGTLIAWVPYMLVVAYLSPKIGSHRAIALGLSTFFILAFIYIFAVQKMNLFH